jgi:hypothetical protein
MATRVFGDIAGTPVYTNVWLAANWTGAALNSGDDAWIPAGTDALTQAGGATCPALNSLHISSGRTSQLGGPGTSGAAVPLAVSATTIYVYESFDDLSGRQGGALFMNLAATSPTVVVYTSSTNQQSTGYAPINILNGSNVVLVNNGGSIDYQTLPNYMATAVSGLTVRQTLVQETVGRVRLGPYVASTALQVLNGLLENMGGAVTLAQVAGEYRAYGTGAHTTLEVHPEGRAYYRASGTITTLDVGGSFSVVGSGVPLTVTNAIKARRGCSLDLRHPNGSTGLALSGGIQAQECALSDFSLLTVPGQSISITGT